MAEKKITSWSYSKLNKYANCPKSVKYSYIDRLPDPAGPPAERGSRIHKLAEDWVGGDEVGALPEELCQFMDEFYELRERNAVCEQQWGFTQKWKPSTWERAWCRMVIDAQVESYDVEMQRHYARCIDYKTGKIREEHGDQLELYALGKFLRSPKTLEYVQTELWYLDHGVLITDLYERTHVEHLLTKWSKKTQPLLTDTEFRATPNVLCSWCAFSKHKGGPCEDSIGYDR